VCIANKKEDVIPETKIINDDNTTGPDRCISVEL